MGKKLFSIIFILCFILTLAACGTAPADTPTKNKPFPEDISEIISDVSFPDISDTSTSDLEMSAEPSAPDASETPSTTTDSAATSTPANSTAAGTNSKQTNPPPTSSTPPQSKPPATSAPTQPPTSTPTPSDPPPTSSTPPTPEYEILGQEYLNGVLAGINERRSALGLPLAKLDSALSNECLVQAKKMAEAGYTFHSENPTGCEGVSKVPYNYPAELMGDVMCSHVPNFLDTGRVKVGVAVVKKGNSLFAVVQGTY